MEARQREREKRQARPNAYLKCLTDAEVKARPLLNRGDHNSTQYMNKYNEELAICEQKYGSGATALSQSQKVAEPRLPVMIGPEGEPGIYARYRASGPVVIALLNADASGRMKDASFVLFDPAWIAGQPAFAFKSGGGRSAAGKSAKRKIEY